MPEELMGPRPGEEEAVENATLDRQWNLQQMVDESHAHVARCHECGYPELPCPVCTKKAKAAELKRYYESIKASANRHEVRAEKGATMPLCSKCGRFLLSGGGCSVCDGGEVANNGSVRTPSAGVDVHKIHGKPGRPRKYPLCKICGGNTYEDGRCRECGSRPGDVEEPTKDLGNCKACGRPFKKRRRCYYCNPARLTETHKKFAEQDRAEASKNGHPLPSGFTENFSGQPEGDSSPEPEPSEASDVSAIAVIVSQQVTPRFTPCGPTRMRDEIMAIADVSEIMNGFDMDAIDRVFRFAREIIACHREGKSGL